MLNAKLVVVGGQTPLDEIELRLPVVVGRGMDVDLPVADELVSRRHAEIFESEGRLFVRDLGSRNGTFVNNRKIMAEAPIEPEELLTLGTLTFRAIYQRQDQVVPVADIQFTDTVRVNFDRTETVVASSNPNLVRNNVAEAPSVANLETVDLDDLQRELNQTLSVESLDVEDLVRRYPK